jgi:hypothetical protein
MMRRCLTGRLSDVSLGASRGNVYCDGSVMPVVDSDVGILDYD